MPPKKYICYSWAITGQTEKSFWKYCIKDIIRNILWGIQNFAVTRTIKSLFLSQLPQRKLFLWNTEYSATPIQDSSTAMPETYLVWSKSVKSILEETPKNYRHTPEIFLFWFHCSKTSITIKQIKSSGFPVHVYTLVYKRATALCLNNNGHTLTLKNTLLLKMLTITWVFTV